jgi:DamX protein
MRTEPSFSENSDDHSLDGNSGDASESQLLSDYRQRYGLSVDPFVDDPHFPFYPGAQRRQILEQLLHLCQFSQNLLVVTGEYGVGKTRMAQALIDGLDDADDICFIEGQITSDIDSLLSEVLAQFELNMQADLAEFFRKKSQQDGLVILIVDNAHHLTNEVISELINLLQENVESRLHLVLFSEPHLLNRLENINAPDIVLTDFFLEKLSLAESVDYLNFRMEMADYLGPEIFIDTKVESWWRQSQGQLLLLHEHAQEKLLASVTTSNNNKSHKPNLLIPHIVATSVLVGGLFVGYLYFGGSSEKKTGPQSKLTESIPVAVQSNSESSTSSITADHPVQVGAAPLPVVVDDKNAESNHSSITAASSISAPNANVSGIVTEKAQVIKQSVVPLVQTNEFHSQPEQKQSKAISSDPSKEIKSAKTFSSEVVVKVATKIKNEGNSSTVSKSPNAFSANEQTILAWDASEFTLQIVGLSSEKAALEFIANQSNKKDLLLFRSLRKRKDWFVVVSGHYPNSLKARQAAQLLPESQLKAAPWPRDLRSVHEEIKLRSQ